MNVINQAIKEAGNILADVKKKGIPQINKPVKRGGK